jgi:hypothetical protein
LNGLDQMQAQVLGGDVLDEPQDLAFAVAVPRLAIETTLHSAC